jgi:hypothetical protein
MNGTNFAHSKLALARDDPIPLLQAGEVGRRRRHRDVRSHDEIVEYGVIRLSPFNPQGFAGLCARVPAHVLEQASTRGSLINLLQHAVQAMVSLTNRPGRWHNGNGLDWVCKSVPRSNGRGACLAYKGSATVFAVSLKSAGA